MCASHSASKRRISFAATLSKYPRVPDHNDTMISAVVMGTNCFCFSNSVRMPPRNSWCCVEASRSEPNCAKAATSRYCANSSFNAPATCFGFDLRGASDAAHGQAHVHGRPDPLVEELGLKEDLPVR